MIHEKINFRSYHNPNHHFGECLCRMPYDQNSSFFVSFLKGLRDKPYFKNNYRTNEGN